MSLRVVIYLLLGILALLRVLYIFTWIKSFLPNGSYPTVDTSRTAVIREIKSLNRLETAQFTIDKVIEAGTDKNDSTFSQILYGDRLLLIAHGTIIGGVDLSKLTENDVQISGQTVTMNLPAPEILVSTIDNAQTKVFDRKLGFLTKGDKNLEAEARQKALSTIEQAACDGAILEQAGDSAKKQLTILLGGLGFTSVTVNVPAGSCKNI
jgi:hypothetical protein